MTGEDDRPEEPALSISKSDRDPALGKVGPTEDIRSSEQTTQEQTGSQPTENLGPGEDHDEQDIDDAGWLCL